MAGTLSACPKDESGLADVGIAAGDPAPDEAAWLRLFAEPGLVRFVQSAALLQAGALAIAFVHPIPASTLTLLVAGLIVTFVLLSLPRLAAFPGAGSGAIETISSSRHSSSLSASQSDLSHSSLSHSHHSHSQADLSPAVRGSGALPSPLPFMGDRITLDPNAIQLTGLARAAARLSRLSPVRGHPWGELIARVSHELRTPLNAVIGFSDVMQSELLGPVGHPRYREYAKHIRDCGRDLLKSAEDTLAITCLLDHDPNSSVDTGVDFQRMVDEAWAFHADANIGHGLTLDADIPAGLEVLVESRPMRQILINLFAEAVRRSDACGSVGLVATVDGDLAQIEVFLRGRPDDTCVGQASLPICLARALLELNGAALIETDDPHSTWRAVTVLRCAAQSDFFRLPEMAERPQHAHLC
ncbi:HAMP domain-containing sensor histidine kinase [Hyphomicrobium sp. LHD-15]|uniref:sensor histidine kinase n=1 Tax=Hyphomicrobium sp. LHD-15 TaxID=3072142 RepID=UPI00280CE69F|nr:HAMP domain-containing sensor histidine kinase [Hyphomicrobium sp. LHD-15]MDQ8697243.1 HAMP domain-containing sensor histidine kinase [Hyphomicrobium sp. LHD-15]